MRIALTARGYEVSLAADGTTGLLAAQKAALDLVIVDLGLPDMDGVSTSRRCAAGRRSPCSCCPPG